MSNWIELSEGKQFSRLLYTNPVSFLCTSLPETIESSNANTMVLSWLTATNNEGSFVFSINRRRYSAELLQANPHFTLSVPIQGSEELIRNVGSVSGRFGSKVGSDSREKDPPPMSRRQKKRICEFPHGIPGLSLEQFHQYGVVVAGTVAHMACHLSKILEDDADHYLVLAKVVKARVKESYWDDAKNLFRPKNGAAPYLTFFGSRTFGYVVAESKDP